MGTARIRQAAGERRSRAAVAAAGLASSLGLWACGGASSGSGALTCSADESGLAVSVAGAGGAIRTRVCDFDDFGRAEAVLPGAAVELVGSLGAFSPRASRVQVLTDFSLDF